MDENKVLRYIFRRASVSAIILFRVQIMFAMEAFTVERSPREQLVFLEPNECMQPARETPARG